MRDIKNIDSKIAKFVTDSLKHIFNSPQIINMIKTNLEVQSILNEQATPSEDAIKHAIVTAALELASKDIADILDKQINYAQMAQQISDTVINQSTELFNIQIENYYENFGFLGRHLKFFETLDDKTANAEQLYNALQDLLKAVNDKNTPLTPEQQYTVKKLSLEKKNTFQLYIKLIHKLEAYAKRVQNDEKEIEPLLLEFTNKDRTKEKLQFTFTVDHDGNL